MMVNLPVVRSSFAFLTLAAVVLLSRHLIAHQVSVDAKKYLLGLYLLLVVVFTYGFGMCRLIVHFVRLLAIQQPGNTHGIYRNGQITPTDLVVLSPRLLKLTRMGRRGRSREPVPTGRYGYF